ncbi:MAG TPA: hypothetical protein VFJ16_31455 [Longimicrobium sp.]|nr:hypothetical protein [Longimicrobium sp.]
MSEQNNTRAEETELNDEALEQVAGGTKTDPVIGPIITDPIVDPVILPILTTYPTLEAM